MAQYNVPTDADDLALLADTSQVKGPWTVIWSPTGSTRAIWEQVKSFRVAKKNVQQLLNVSPGSRGSIYWSDGTAYWLVT